MAAATTKEEVLRLFRTPTGSEWNDTLEVFVKINSDGQILISPGYREPEATRNWIPVSIELFTNLYRTAIEKANGH